jgi:hypothetical protein
MGIPVLKIPMGTAKGLYQGQDDNLMSLAYSPDCQNIDVSEGILATVKGSTRYNPSYVPVADYTIKRLLPFTADVTGEVIFGMDRTSPTAYKWYAHDGKEIITEAGASLTTINPNRAHSAMTKIGSTPYMILAGDAHPVKIWWDAIYYGYRYAELGGSPPHVNCITTHRERVWMAKAVTVSSNENILYYSNAFDPEDWSTAGETGEITIETLDGDFITNIANIFDDVVVFKNNSIWKIVGDTPSEYSVEKVYSMQGAIYPDSICTDGNLCFFVGIDGIYRYDGVNVTPVMTMDIKQIFDNVQGITCGIYRNKLYVFDRKTTSAYIGKHIEYDIITRTINVIKAHDSVYDACVPEIMRKRWYTDGTYLFYLDDTKITFHTVNIDAYWITPDTDFGYPNATKYLTNIYFNAWGTDNAGAAGGQIKITVYANKKGTVKTKEKTITLSTTRKPHDIRFMIPGRIFKFKIENVSGSAFSMTPPVFVFELAED